MKKEKYLEAIKQDQKVIDAINSRWNKPGRKWIIRHSEFKQDMDGIDAIGHIETFKKGNIKLLIQIKNISFRKLGKLKKEIYLTKISKKMTEFDPEASQRLLCYTEGKNGNIGMIYNYNIKKQLEDLKKIEA